MLDIVDNDIFLTRGDTADISIDIVLCNKETHESYEIQPTDRIIFRMKRRERSDNYLIEKEVALIQDDEDNIYAVLHLEPEDTLHVPFGKNRFELELITEDDQHYTIIADHMLVVGKELENHG